MIIAIIASLFLCMTATNIVDSYTVHCDSGPLSIFPTISIEVPLQIPTIPCYQGTYHNLVSFGDSWTWNGVGPLTEDSYKSRDFKERNTNGPTWVEYLATYLGADLYDQAYSGATANNSVVPRSVPDISEQILEFNSNNLNLDSAKTLYIIWTGVNDVHDIYVKTNDTTTQNILLNSIIDSVTEEVNSLLPADHLLIMGLAPIERLPLFSSLSDPTALTNLIQTYNEKLKALAASHYPFTRFINTKFMFEKYITFHNSYGYVDTTQACCLDLEQCAKSQYSYLWWDEWHPTTKTHQLIATDVFHDLHK